MAAPSESVDAPPSWWMRSPAVRVRPLSARPSREASSHLKGSRDARRAAPSAVCVPGPRLRTFRNLWFARPIEEACGRRAGLAAEGCPEHCLLREGEILDKGTPRTFTPPARVRSDADATRMRGLLSNGAITHVMSDYVPATFEEKSEGGMRDVRFGLPGLGTTGSMLFDPSGACTLDDTETISKTEWTLYVARIVRGRVLGTWQRRVRIAADGQLLEGQPGRVVVCAGSVATR